MDAIPSDADKKNVFLTVEKFLLDNGLRISGKDTDRPWGGFFVIDDSSLQPFLELFFQNLELEKKNPLSPKVLVVEPGKRLSWQYHNRRSEYWTIAAGQVGVIISDDDQQQAVRELEAGNLIGIEQGQRHRLVGLDEWGIVAEIWRHSDFENPSDEDDIIRLEDDFGR